MPTHILSLFATFFLAFCRTQHKHSHTPTVLLHFFCAIVSQASSNVCIFLKIMMLFYMLSVWQNDDGKWRWRICQVFVLLFPISLSVSVVVSLSVINERGWCRHTTALPLVRVSWKVYWNCIMLRVGRASALTGAHTASCLLFESICYLSQEFKIRIFYTQHFSHVFFVIKISNGNEHVAENIHRVHEIDNVYLLLLL